MRVCVCMCVHPLRVFVLNSVFVISVCSVLFELWKYYFTDAAENCAEWSIGVVLVALKVAD